MLYRKYGPSKIDLSVVGLGGIVVKDTFTRRTPSYGSGYGLTERQTGESFKSAAPPDCRVTG